MVRMKAIIIGLLVFASLSAALTSSPTFRENELEKSALPTYFSYAASELAPLIPLHSNKEMTRKELSEWDKVTFDLIYQKKEESASRIEAYLYVAQRDAAYLSYQLRQRFEGSLTPISKKVLALFFPSLDRQDRNEDEDAYSQVLASIVLAKIQARLQEDLHATHPYQVKRGETYWSGKVPFWGLATGSWKPWIIKSGHQFRALAPPLADDPIWKVQLQQVKEACENVTQAQKGAIYFWAGRGSRGSFQSGEWLKIANDYMWTQKIALPDLLLVRSTLAMGIADASIAVFDSKYTYWVKRPHMLDPSLHALITVPNHPSYPSGHSTISTASKVILTYFFPQERSLWNELAQEAGLSRIWCGIHFPIDNAAGMAMGEKIGQAVVEALKNNERSVDVPLQAVN